MLLGCLKSEAVSDSEEMNIFVAPGEVREDTGVCQLGAV